MGEAQPTVRLKSGADLPLEVEAQWARRDPPPLRYGAARLCIVSRLEIGRDVGLAKVGFSPYRS
jgi:hypothetical protein